jgi:hypothetical protein
MSDFNDLAKNSLFEKGHQIGSSSNSVVEGQVDRQHPGSQEFGACATVHRALEGFQSIDRPFGLAVAPALGQRVCHGVEISPQGIVTALRACGVLAGRVAPRG